ncbi:hypothetical protein H105_06630 [Trichophyton soudanense CBS 452.61]|uniref:C3H1-type domain-containing protein n=1 Tax=Trichophyton soudanense CBS 452.61 TaxID=1215331 RepID=A0A022XKF0_TRISD|nr:hypothetical protein H105_06630 [Trichophyton soudanense CBS 452.61]
MSGFSFPPPPPPPPPTQPSQPTYNSSSRGGGGGGRGSSHHRGRGRGNGPRRGGRGGGYGSDMNASWGYAPPHQHQPQHLPMHPNQGACAYGPLPGYGGPHTPAPAPAPAPPPQTMHFGPPQGGYLPPAAPYADSRAWTFNPKQTYTAPAYQRPHQKHTHTQALTHRPPKRQHDTAFTTAPLPVPSFNTLPSKPPPVQAQTKGQANPARPRKQRKHNQLGLTPKTEEHESSESEAEDVDEEAKFAGLLAKGELKFSYRGRTSTLGSTAEVQAWIEERKRRFPTQARIEERKKEEEARKAAKRQKDEEMRKQREEAKKKREEERKKREAEAAEAKKAKGKEKQKQQQQQQQQKKGDASDVAARAKMRADKLREKLARQERKLAQAEAAAAKQQAAAEAEAEASARAGTAAAAGQPEAGGQARVKLGGDEAVASTTTTPSLPTATAIAPQDHTPVAAGATKTLTPDLGNQASGADDDSGSDSTTSSEGESESESESGSNSDSESDSGSEPEQTSSRRQGPDRVPPRRRCHQFARTGQCRHGSSCTFLHEKKNQGQPKEKDRPREQQQQQQRKGDKPRAGRKSLYERAASAINEDMH